MATESDATTNHYSNCDDTSHGHGAKGSILRTIVIVRNNVRLQVSQSVLIHMYIMVKIN